LSCSSCGAGNDPTDRFCGQCGTALVDGVSAVAAASTLSQRRLVSVLFADLVGFTTLSEHRDPEEVRELLSRYFDRCKTLIERYGGTVEKFIGDAVMAVWGTPVAREDDAERAVRAGLALAQAVGELSDLLRLRVGVLTGPAAVELGSESEGMVLGDTVNTASRLQSLADPGAVLVDDVTRRASEAAIAYEDAGTHTVKGREQLVHAWLALRVVAGAGGARRSVGLEAPFVGREHELHAITEASEVSAGARQARLVTILGEAGAGKSRLLWEFFKYVDGIEDTRWWHQGRCLSYGEGVAYWALAEMVRSRAQITEEEDPASAREKLRAAVAEHVPDERERRLVEPRLAHLIGLEHRSAPDRADLFSGWRLFLERMADINPVILAFEDLQWADSGLLDFIDYLLEWSADFPIFILALGRPELLAARPGWEPTIELGPLDAAVMARLLTGLVPGLPDELASQIRRRAEGVPLYAVETVRMLLDRGLVAEQGNRYVVTGDVADLEVPETLQALAAARLDNLSADERALLQDASVIGQSFTPATVTAVVDRPAAEVQGLLDGLVAKQVLAFIDDARSGERGQYAFLQALLCQVALGTLSRRDRKARHLAVARHLHELWGDGAGEIAEVLASHYLAAVEADPGADDAASIRDSACETLEEAGNRALSLALGLEARRHFERAAELAVDPAVRGRLLREAGLAAQQSAELEDAVRLLSAARSLFDQAGLEREVARIDGLMGYALRLMGRFDEAVVRVEQAFALARKGGDDEIVAELASARASMLFMKGDREQALEVADTALRIADGLRLPRVLVGALITKSNALAETGRPVESGALMARALSLALEQDLDELAVRAYFNLADGVMSEARFADADEQLERGLELVRRRGDRQGERQLLAQRIIAQVALGHWDEALAQIDSLRSQQGEDLWSETALATLPYILVPRGELSPLRPLFEQPPKSEWPEINAMLRVGHAMFLRETGRAGDAVAEARDAAATLIATATSQTPLLFAEAIDCVLAAGEPDVARELLALVDELAPAQLIPVLEAEAARGRGLLAARIGDPAADNWFRRAVSQFRELGTPFHLARAQLQYAEWLEDRRDDEAASLRGEAAATFSRLGATPWLERARVPEQAVPA
jgi:class 3 adenylate cyclase/tetratricopeptide (TPR) repeat protein